MAWAAGSVCCAKKYRAHWHCNGGCWNRSDSIGTLKYASHIPYFMLYRPSPAKCPFAFVCVLFSLFINWACGGIFERDDSGAPAPSGFIRLISSRHAAKDTLQSLRIIFVHFHLHSDFRGKKSARVSLIQSVLDDEVMIMSSFACIGRKLSFVPARTPNRSNIGKNSHG